MPRNYVKKGNYRSRAIGKGVKLVGVSLPEGLLKLVDRMVRGGLGVSRQDIILKALAAFAVQCVEGIDEQTTGRVEETDGNEQAQSDSET